jgi:hypothetical protein
LGNGEKKENRFFMYGYAAIFRIPFYLTPKPILSKWRLQVFKKPYPRRVWQETQELDRAAG